MDMSNMTRSLQGFVQRRHQVVAWVFARSLLLILAWKMPIAEAAPQDVETASPVLLVPDAVWDGARDVPQKGFVVLIKGSRIEAIGRAAEIEVPASAERVDLP